MRDGGRPCMRTADSEMSSGGTAAAGFTRAEESIPLDFLR